MKSNPIVQSVLLASVIGASPYLAAQLGDHNARGAADEVVVLPERQSLPMGSIDPSAALVIKEYQQVMGKEQPEALHGSGSITYGAQDGPYPADLYIYKQRDFKLEVRTPDGVVSSIFRHGSAAIRTPAGKSQVLPPDFARAGLLQSFMVRQLDLQDPTISVRDSGVVKEADGDLRLITIQKYQKVRVNKAEPVARLIQSVDCYFDVRTNLLMKTAMLVRVGGARGHEFLRVISYGDYRDVGGRLLPYTYKESLDGQITWLLQLNSIDQATSLQPLDFSF